LSPCGWVGRMIRAGRQQVSKAPGANARDSLRQTRLEAEQRTPLSLLLPHSPPSCLVQKSASLCLPSPPAGLPHPQVVEVNQVVGTASGGKLPHRRRALDRALVRGMGQGALQAWSCSVLCLQAVGDAQCGGSAPGEWLPGASGRQQAAAAPVAGGGGTWQRP
jgi:hypothetical protein